MASNDHQEITEQSPVGPNVTNATVDSIEKATQAQMETVHLGNANFSDKILNEEAKQATAAEHSLTFWTAIKIYRRAVFWSLLISATVIMEGYDVTLIGSFFGYPAFRRKYGEYHSEEHGYQISAPWQAGINDIQAVGSIIGALLNGWGTHKYGHRRVIMVTLVALTASIFIVFFAPNITVILIGEFFCSIPFGVFATTGPAYAAEVVPLALRGYLTAYVNLCWAIGQLLSAGVLKGLVNNPTQWSYKIPFAIQWVWPVPLFIAALMAPESPWFLVRAGRLADAEKSLERLSERSHHVDHKATVALMVHTTKLEEEEQLGITYWDAFKGTNRRRTEIACMAFLSQITDGGALCYSATFFFEQAGISPDASYALGLGGTGIAFCGTIISWFYLARWGRRTIWLYGFYMLLACLWLIGILACVPNQTTAIVYGQAALCLVWLGSYSMSVGPIVYTIVAEIGATRLRTQTVVLGRSTYYLGNIIGGVLQPKFMSPTGWNAKGKTAFFWGTLSALTTLWGFFRLPETKDRTFEELDILFQKGIPSRKFADYVIGEEDEYVVGRSRSVEEHH